MSLLNHVTNIITKPKAEWEVIKTEQMTVMQLFTGYICILAAIPAVASFIGLSLIGYTYPNPFGGASYSFKFGISAGLINAVSNYILGLVGVYVSALVINALAKNFASTPDMMSALKLVAFAYTPTWLCGIFSIYSPISWLGILGLYSIALFYLGLGPLMNTPPGKKAAYMIVSAIILIVIFVIIGLIVNVLTPMPSVESILHQMNFDLK